MNFNFCNFYNNEEYWFDHNCVSYKIIIICKLYIFSSTKRESYLIILHTKNMFYFQFFFVHSSLRALGSFSEILDLSIRFVKGGFVKYLKTTLFVVSWETLAINLQVPYGRISLFLRRALWSQTIFRHFLVNFLIQVIFLNFTSYKFKIDLIGHIDLLN